MGVEIYVSQPANDYNMKAVKMSSFHIDIHRRFKKLPSLCELEVSDAMAD